MVTFAYHDILTKPPKEGVFSDYERVLCRNVLIYFTRDAQEQTKRSCRPSSMQRLSSPWGSGDPASSAIRSI